MQILDGRPVYSATDLVGFLACTHLTDLERAALGGLTADARRGTTRSSTRSRSAARSTSERYREGLEAGGRHVTSLDEDRPES